MDALPISPGQEGVERMKELKRKRQNDQMILYMFILSMLVLAFILGYYEFSLVWIFILGLLTLVVWNRRVLDLTERYIHEKETLLLRKKALRQNETCEWLNFIINRWFVFSSNSFSEVIKRKIDTFLINVQPYFLSSLEFKQLKIDNQTPCIQSIHAFEVDEGNRKSINWSNILSPPPGLKMAQKYQLVVEIRLEITADQFMELTAKLSGKWLGLSLDLMIEKMSVKAIMQVGIHLDKDTPFPHVTSVTSCFIEKPEVWFNVRVLRHVQIMEIPLLKLWVHNMVMNALTEALVDPGKLEVTFNKRGSVGPVVDRPPTKKLAVGLLTVAVNGHYKSSSPGNKNKRTSSNPLELLNDTRYCLVAIDDHQSSSSSLTSGSSPFSHTASFLIYNLAIDQLKLKLKSKVLLTNQSLAYIVLPLNSFALEQKSEVDTTVDEQLERTNETLKMNINMKFTSLQSIEQVIQKGHLPIPNDLKLIKCGVLNICIHGASDLPGLDRDGKSDPYCMLYNNGKKILCTHYIPHTRNPKWDTYTQFIVEDINKIVLSFVVYDWDGPSAHDDDFLGSTHIVMSLTNNLIIHQCFPLNSSLLSVTSDEASTSQKKGCIILSVVFVPIKDVAVAEERTSFASQSKTSGSSPSQGSDSPQSLLTGDGLMELHIIQAMSLLAADRNGLSDPFCDVMVGKVKKYSTTIRKKTLNPVWNERCTVEMPREDELLEISVWDHDVFSRNDFIGCLTLTNKQLIDYGNDPQFDGWFKLEKVPQGSIQLKIRVFINEPQLQPPTTNSEVMMTSSPLLNPADVTNMYTSTLPTTNHMKASLQPPQCNSDSNLETNHSSFNQQTNHHNSQPNNLRDHNAMDGTALHNGSVRSLVNDSMVSRRMDNLGRSMKKMASVMSRSKCSKEDVCAVPSKLYAGIKIEVYLIEGLPNTSHHMQCVFKLKSSSGHRKKVVAKSSHFIPSNPLNMDFKFEVDDGCGERSDSILNISIKSGLFTYLGKVDLTLESILPAEPDHKQSSTITMDQLQIHLNCSYDTTLNTNSATENRRNRKKSQ